MAADTTPRRGGVNDEDSNADFARLADELQTLNRHRFVRIHNSLWRLVMFQFLRGLAFGLGSVVGATVLVSIVVWWLSQFEFIPIVGDWLGQLVDQIETTRDPE